MFHNPHLSWLPSVFMIVGRTSSGKLISTEKITYLFEMMLTCRWASFCNLCSAWLHLGVQILYLFARLHHRYKLQFTQKETNKTMDGRTSIYLYNNSYAFKIKRYSRQILEIVNYSIAKLLHCILGVQAFNVKPFSLK